MAIGEDTVLDAPTTPAPVFAYRALKAVIWGEDDTPQHHSRTANSTTGVKATNSRSSQQDNIKFDVHLTPGQKRKHAAVFSPTKSILRTPGVQTPRKALLKDLNVTFRDPRKSDSPDVVWREGHITGNDNKENISAATVKIGASKTHQPPESCAPTEAVPVEKRQRSITSTLPRSSRQQDVSVPVAKPLQSRTTPSLPSVAVFDAEAYMQNTEKEMKKLIKYGQKMREYARRQDEENNKLRIMLDELRGENERLKQQQLERSNAQKGDDKPPAIITKSTSTSVTSGFKTHNQAKNSSDRRSTAQSNTFDLLDLCADMHDKPPQAHDNQRLMTSNKRTAAESQPKPDQYLSSTQETSPTKKQQHHHPSSTISPILPPKLAQGAHATLQTHQPNLPLRAISNSSTSNAANLRIGPDRLAAARARVKKKAEMRRTSAESPVGMEGQTVTKDEGANKVETSLVDWAGL